MVFTRQFEKITVRSIKISSQRYKYPSNVPTNLVQSCESLKASPRHDVADVQQRFSGDVSEGIMQTNSTEVHVQRHIQSLRERHVRFI